MTTVAVIAAACILVAGLFAVIVERTNERDEARTEAERLALVLAERDAELGHADALITQLAAEAASAPVPFVPVEPVLSVVPPQRDGSEYEWPAIARDAFPIPQWGEEAES